MHLIVSMIPDALSPYSPRIHSAPRNTLPLLISLKHSCSFSRIPARSSGNFSTTSRTKAITSTADALDASPRNSIRTCTTFEATDECWIAQVWIVWIKSWRYSGFCTPSAPHRSTSGTHLLELPILRLDELLLKETDDLLHIPAAHHLQRDPQGLPPDLHVRARKHTQNVHHKLVEDVLVLVVEGGDAREDDRFDVVGRLLEDERDEAPGSSWKDTSAGVEDAQERTDP